MSAPLRLSLLLIAIGLAGCGGSVSHSNTPGPTPAPFTATADHVVLVVLENHSFNEVIGSSSMPYLNALASQHALATNYFADAHPSLTDYFLLTTGLPETIDNNFAGTVTDDNMVRALTGSNKTWRAYMEGLPSVGYAGDDVWPYLKHHDPFVYLSDVLSSTAMSANVVPVTQLSADLSSGTLQNFSFVAPDAENDAHSCPGNAPTCPDTDKLVRADNWLKNNIDPLINSPAFGNGVVIITWDEGDVTDIASGGGQVATVLVGPHVKTGFRSVTFYDHESTLRLILDLLHVSDHPGASAFAPSMGEFFQ
ncbi:MAG TPA: alkaline phosphatase family protein [Candidatus Angelobacter sp.]|nr:alkaline phosphatase family protein [Candidatus Angelobacter sp.]